MAKPIPEMPSSVFVALVGRPNVGKSQPDPTTLWVKKLLL